MPDDFDAIVQYHERTKHHLNRYAAGPGQLDWATQPDPFRRYAGTEHLSLPLAADRITLPFSALHQAGHVSPSPLDREHVGILFELSMALSAWKAAGQTRWALRCNPSSGNLHPTEAYLVCPDLPDLPGGVHHYLSLEHLLETRARPSDAWNPRWPCKGVIVGLSSIHWREAWKYGERAYRYCQHDAGHALAALRYAAATLGWQARLLDRWGDADIAALLGLDRAGDFADAEREAPDLLLWIGPELMAPDPDDLLTALADARWQGRANRLSPQHRPWPAIDAASEASVKPRISGEDQTVTRPELPSPAASAADITAARIIRQRRSAVDFDSVGGMSRDSFFQLLDLLLPRPQVPPLDALPWAPRVHLCFFVHRVQGLTPGLYLLARRPEALPVLQAAMRPDWLWEMVPDCPTHIPFRMLLPTDMQSAARLMSCHQDIAADSAFSLAMLAEFEAPLAEGPWHYRELFWECGALGQILYLEAEARGLRGTGIGCYFDDALHDLLGLKDRQFQDLYHFTVGQPVEDPRLSTLPAYPAT